MLAKTQKAALRYATARKTSLPILNCVEIGQSADGGFQYLKTNNLDYQVEVTTPECTSDKHILVDKKVVLSCLGQSWKVEKERATFSGDGSSRTVSTKDLSEFPTVLLDDFKAKATVTFQLEDIRPALSYCLRAVSDDFTRLPLTGIMLELAGDDTFRLIATNGHCLYQHTGKVENASNETVILGGEFCRFLTRLPQKTGQLVCRIGETYLIATLSTESCDVRIVSRNIEGPYPDYRQVIPDIKAMAKLSITDAKAFIEACSEIAPATSKVTKQVTWTTGGPDSEFSVDNPETGKMTVTVPGTYPSEDWYAKPLDRIGFNITYLKNLVPSDAKTITVYGNSHERAFLFTFDNEVLLALLMPLRLSD